jgi:hypothetical protein
MVLAEVAAVADQYWIPYYNVECRVIKGDNKPLSQAPLNSLPFPSLALCPAPAIHAPPLHAAAAAIRPLYPHCDISSLLAVQHRKPPGRGR